MKSRLFVSVLLSFCVLFQSTCADRILVITFVSTKSHKITYMRLIEELANRGHDITVLSPIKPNKEVKNIKEIYTLDLEAIFEKDHFNAFEMKEKQQTNNPLVMIKMATEVCKQSYDLPQVKAIMKEKFDLIFMQPFFNDCLMGLVYRMQTPLVLFSPTSVASFMASAIGNDFPPSFTPNPFLGYPDEMTFYQRFINYGITLFVDAVLQLYYEPIATAIYREKLGNDIPSSREIMGNASLILSNGHFSLNKPKPYLPDIIDVGGIHSHPAKPLPKDVEEFVTKSGKDGFILFSMGSAIKGDQMPEKTRKMFLNAFSKLKQQVLWKWESETMPDLPKNVKLSKWLPQQDLLGHPNIKMFITHCGGGSTEEAIYHGVPLLGIPMLGDQPMNAANAKVHGFVVALEWNTLTEEQLSNGINEILTDPKYRNNVKRLSKIFKDQPNDPLERGVYWVEYVLRHKGAPHLRSASRKLNYFQYHSWDVIAAYVAIILGLVYLIVSIVKFLVRKVCGSSKSAKTLKLKKN